MPEISVIVPVYNVEEYLHHCVDSILGQTFTDFELILVDDGSPDNCGLICDEYATKDTRVRVFHGENAGVSSARNKGIELSKGRYIAFVDGDDVLSSNYCEVLYSAIVEHNVHMVACSIDRFSGENPLVDDLSCGKVSTMPFADFLKRQMNGKIEISVCNRLFHRSIFERVCFITNRRYEDILFAADLLAAHFENVVYVDTPLYHYRQQANSFMNHQSISMTCNSDRIFAANYLIGCARQAGYVYMNECLAYAVQYPWFFVDSIYVNFRFRRNKNFLEQLQKMIRNNREEYRELPLLSEIQRKRMLLFARSKILYGFNAYARLLRVYIYHVLKRDAYADGHGI